MDENKKPQLRIAVEPRDSYSLAEFTESLDKLAFRVFLGGDIKIQGGATEFGNVEAYFFHNPMGIGKSSFGIEMTLEVAEALADHLNKSIKHARLVRKKWGKAEGMGIR